MSFIQGSFNAEAQSTQRFAEKVKTNSFTGFPLNRFLCVLHASALRGFSLHYQP